MRMNNSIYFIYTETLELQICEITTCVQLEGKCIENSIVGNNCTCLGVINCSIPITDCSCSTNNNPCYNGTCLDYEEEGYWCNCTDGWSGEYCDIDDDFCPSNESYCQHGVCVEGVGTEHYCSCDETYRGELCDDLFCPDNYCFNNGTTSCKNESDINSLNDLNCTCKVGYYGDRCENEGKL